MSSELIVLGSVDLRNVTLEKIAALMEGQEGDAPSRELRTEHVFTPHLCSRTLYVPAGSAIVTMMHKTEHQFVVSQGGILVYALGGQVDRIQAPYIGVTKAGTIRLAVALTDVVWTTFHTTDETDVEKLEKLLVMSPREALKFKEQKCLLPQS